MRALEAKIANHLRARQAEHGGWPLYHNGELDLSCTVKAYYASEARRRQRAGAAHDAKRATPFCSAAAPPRPMCSRASRWRCSASCRGAACLIFPWKSCCCRDGFHFIIDKVSYWSRTVMVPLFILCTRKPQAKNPRNVGIRELFTTPPEKERHYFRRAGLLAKAFLLFDRDRPPDRPLGPRRHARTRDAPRGAVVLERLNGEDGLGAIFPAMVNALEAMVILGYASRRSAARHGQDAPCRSCWWWVPRAPIASPASRPFGIRALAALGACRKPVMRPRATRRRVRSTGCKTKQLLDRTRRLARATRPDLAGGGWAFQFANDYLPGSRRHGRGRVGHASGAAIRRGTRKACAARSIGWWECKAAMADLRHSMRTTPATT